MTDDPIAALRAAYEKTTPGTWEVGSDEHEIANVGIDIGDNHSYAIAENINAENAAFIVAAHQHTPALLAECERLRAENAQLNDFVAKTMLHNERMNIKQDAVIQELNEIKRRLGIGVQPE